MRSRRTNPNGEPPSLPAHSGWSVTPNGLVPAASTVAPLDDPRSGRAEGGFVLEWPQLDPEQYHREVLPGLAAAANGALAASALGDAPPLATRVDGNAWTYRRDGDHIAVSPGVADDAAVVMGVSRAAWSDLVQLRRTVPALMIGGEIEVTGSGALLDRWERALRALWQGL